MNHHLKGILLFFLIVLAAPGFVLGGDLSSEQCFRSSPSAQKEEDLYKMYDVRILTDQELADAHMLFNNMIGRWQGSMDEINCRGAKENPTKDMAHHNASANISFPFEKELLIRTEHYNAANRTWGHTLYSFVRKDKLFMLNISGMRLLITDGLVPPIYMTMMIPVFANEY